MSSMVLELLQNVRILVQEDTLELPVTSVKNVGFNIQRLKTRSPIETAATSVEMAAEDSLRTALRLGESVLLLGEVRSKEARTLYEAMRIGAVGNVVMGTIHGDSPYGVWDRVVNDLGVPSTSFKATDFIITCVPIRLKGSLRAKRRVIDITEVGKDWLHDPKDEDGLLTVMDYAIKKDDLELLEDSFAKSAFVEKVRKRTDMGFEEVMKEIKSRAQAKQYLVNVKNKLEIPKLLEAVNTVPANTKYMVIEEKQRDETGAVNHKKLLDEWRTWVDTELIKPLVREKKM